MANCWHCGEPAGESTLVLDPENSDSWRRPVCRPCLIDFGLLDPDTAVEDEIGELVQLLAELEAA